MNKKGFTLVELMAVIAIIGIIATIGVNGYGSIRKKTELKTVESDLNLIVAKGNKYGEDNKYDEIITDVSSEKYYYLVNEYSNSVTQPGDNTGELLNENYVGLELKISYENDRIKTCVLNTPNNLEIIQNELKYNNPEEIISDDSFVNIICDGDIQNKTKCPDGYQDKVKEYGNNISDCEILVEGGYQIDTPGSSNAKKCPAGTYSNSKYIHYGDTYECTLCELGSTSEEGADHCYNVADNICPEGYRYGKDYYENDISECIRQVNPGHYIETRKSTTEPSCPKDTYKEGHTVGYGQTSSCKSCPAGTTTNGKEGANNLSECVNPQADTPETTLYECPVGYQDGGTITTSAKLKGCYTNVAEGQYVNLLTGTARSYCAIGYYSSEHKKYYGDTDSCTKCPAGTTTRGTGSTSIDVCVEQLECPVGYRDRIGYYPTMDTSYKGCYKYVEDGYYIAKSKDVNPTPCPVNTFKTGTAVWYGDTSYCISCPTGTTTNGKTGQASCVSSQSGTSTNTQTTKYYNCPTGYQAGGATTTDATLKSCYKSVNEGHYVAAAKATADTMCGYGSYNSKHIVYYGDSDSCTKCPTGYTTANKMASTQKNCQINVSPGYQLTTKNSSTTSICPVNTYSSGGTVTYGNTLKCTSCPTGTTTNGKTGQTSSTACVSSASTCSTNYSVTINDYHYIGCDQYFITTCQPDCNTSAKCNYIEKNGASATGTVTRQPLKPSYSSVSCICDKSDAALFGTYKGSIKGNYGNYYNNLGYEYGCTNGNTVGYGTDRVCVTDLCGNYKDKTAQEINRIYKGKTSGITTGCVANWWC